MLKRTIQKQINVRTQLRAGEFSVMSCDNPAAQCPTMECRNDASPYRINQKYARCLTQDLLGCVNYPGGAYCETRAECEALCTTNLIGEPRMACLGVCLRGKFLMPQNRLKK